MSRIPEDMLGKKLDDYLLNDYHPKQLPPDSLLQRLDSDDTIQKILAKDNVTAATLHDLTRLVLVPNCLLSLRGTQIMPALMELFHSYTRDHQPYEYEYGLHCVEAILFALLIGILAGIPAGRSTVLEIYVYENQVLSSRTPSFFHNMLEKSLGVTLELCGEVDERNEIFWGFNASTRTLVPVLGGFTIDDLHYFIGAIWEGRKHMFWAHTIIGVPALWRCGIAVLSLFHRRTQRNHELTPKIYALAMRLELNCREDKYHLLDLALDITSKFPNASAGVHPGDSVVDIEDAKLVLRKYYPWIVVLDRRRWRTLSHCVLTAGSIVIQLYNLELHLEFLKAHLRVIWSEVLRHDINPGDMNEGTPLLVFTISTLKHIECMITKNKTENMLACIDQLFAEGDFVNLMGRILLSFRHFANFTTSHQETKDLTQQFDILDDIFTTLAQTTGFVVSPLLIKTSHAFNIRADWNKIMAFFKYSPQLPHVENDQTPLTYFDKKSKVIWEVFERMIPYVLDLYCANPDCGRINPSMECARCHTMRYCNTGCQQR
ncbi:hypothetical protein FRC09_013754 [Ceratobasidium sp. 395]|nr:hypothetical protein FRC09_013754 [Ceratobasidium sp. 395]